MLTWYSFYSGVIDLAALFNSHTPLANQTFINSNAVFSRLSPPACTDPHSLSVCSLLSARRVCISLARPQGSKLQFSSFICHIYLIEGRMASQMVVPASKDTLFMRGFSARREIDEIR